MRRLFGDNFLFNLIGYEFLPHCSFAMVLLTVGASESSGGMNELYRRENIQQQQQQKRRKRRQMFNKHTFGNLTIWLCNLTLHML